MVTVSESTRLPLQAGVYPSGLLTSHQAAQIAEKAAQQALAEMRAERKHGRQDQGTGSDKLGGILFRYRHQEGLTQSQLATSADLHSTTVGKIETGERGMSLQTFCRLADVLGEHFANDVISEVSSWP